MTKYIRKSDHVDVMLLAEGTYPYIRGGVSSWIAQILEGLPEIRFGICFIGSQESDYDHIHYDLPENLTHLEVHYLFDIEQPDVEVMKGDKEGFQEIRKLYTFMKEGKDEIPDMIKDIAFYTKKVPFEQFLYAKRSWEFINEQYMKNCPDIPFIDYFWTLRNIHQPIWVIAHIVEKLPPYKLLHAPSTGYAGFLGALASYHSDRPLYITEHGLYTRERKIDMLTAEWIDFQKPSLLKQPEEFNYIKGMWVNFFEKIGEFAYNRANLILSLYSGAREIQIGFGADEAKTRVIPNGIDVPKLKALQAKREEIQKPIISLIGRVVSIKDIKTFIRAIRITINTIPDLEAWIVGPTDEDKEYYEECVHMVESFGLEENIKFLGFRDIKEILPQTSLMTLTSISEGMPLVILEGFAAGVPCVATDVGSCRDLIEGALDEEDIGLGSAGAVTNIANPNELAQQYIAFLLDEEKLKAAQSVGLARVEKYYTQEVFLARYNEIYQEAMEKE